MLTSRQQLTEDSDLDARMQIQDKIAMISAEVRNAKDGISQLKEIQVPSTMEHRTRMNDYHQLNAQHAQQAKRFKDLVEKFATVVQQAQLKAK